MFRSRLKKLQHSLAWLKNVAGLDDDYVKKWSPAEWEAWQAAMLADPSGDNPSVPGWMNPIIRDTWHNDFSFPFPQVAQLISAHPWFHEALKREDFSLKVTEPLESDGPVLSQVEAAYNEAMLRGWTPLLSLLIEPTQQPKIVVGAIESFYIVAPAFDSADVSDLMQHFDLPSPSTRLAGPAQHVPALLERAHQPVPDGRHVAWGSEWMYV